jgi:hypothetical protein
MDENEFTEAESNMHDLISEYQQYQVRARTHNAHARDEYRPPKLTMKRATLKPTTTIIPMTLSRMPHPVDSLVFHLCSSVLVMFYLFYGHLPSTMFYRIHAHSFSIAAYSPSKSAGRTFLLFNPIMFQSLRLRPRILRFVM